MAKRSGAAHVVTIVKRVKDREYRTPLLRRSYRNGATLSEELDVAGADEDDLYAAMD